MECIFVEFMSNVGAEHYLSSPVRASVHNLAPSFYYFLAHVSLGGHLTYDNALCIVSLLM